MSVCVTIKTEKKFVPKDLFVYLAKQGERLIVTSEDFPYVRFGSDKQSIRGVEVSEDEAGYEVTAFTLSSIADYKLFAKTVQAVIAITGGRAYYEDEDEDEVDNPAEYFNSEWFFEQYKSGFDCVRALVGRGSFMTMGGMFMDICIGPHLLYDFGINKWGCADDRSDALMSYVCKIQWHCAGLTNTGTSMILPSPDGDTDKNLTISAIGISEGKVSDFDYISYADLLGIFDMDDESNPPVLIPFNEAWKILPKGVFKGLDEVQYIREGELTVDMVHQMMEKARHLQPDDLFYKPKYPGEGFDDKQNTVILMWNPAISSVKLSGHCNCIETIDVDYFNWSVWEHEKAKCGDRFFLVRVGEGKTGIVMSGVFDSQPYTDRDWSGRGRITYYMDMLPNVILDPEEAPMITTDRLSEAIPSFGWSGGHSGRILAKEDAAKLETMWRDFLVNNEDSVDGETFNVNYLHTYDSFGNE